MPTGASTPPAPPPPPPAAPAVVEEEEPAEEGTADGVTDALAEAALSVLNNMLALL